jgi:predicted RNA-binding Zn-ribbon protein involved in translation (DUF1610 family)
MWNEEVERVVQEVAEGVMQEVKEWRLQNPKATFREIEAAVDGSWARARARLLQEVVLTSEAREVSSDSAGGGYQCPQCYHPLESRGQRSRDLITHCNQSITLKRSYGVCPACGTGLFPPG